MTYWRLYYHLIWATKNRAPRISADIAPSIHCALASKAKQMGAIVHAVNGIENHVHLVVSVPSAISLARFVRHLKGFSSHFANHQISHSVEFRWQAEYGVVSFDGRTLDKVIQYVLDQQRHHTDGTTISIFEKATGQLAARVGQ